MKKALLFLVLPCILVYAACKKAPLGEDGGCISEYVRPLNPVGVATYARIKTVFQNNGISTESLSFYGAIENDTIHLDGQTNIYYHYTALQYFNGLPVLNGDIGYHFKNGQFTVVIGTKYDGVNLNTSKHLKVAQVRKLFLNEIEKDGFTENHSLKDSCFKAEFGYLNLDHSSVSTKPVWAKVWKVTPANREYPVAYFKDDDAATISYFNGIMTVTN
ncbi:hypothetical protein [Mucilaginibacter pedocola]|nr:hypothetical protein [Mucilaginibacter pedocola]